ncbi:hypothetical protein OX284_017000 [Flavobacterium sp. SUN046]|uniref:hypothetical protein n=1 Tax=Flavobacterium sp. SUN046 TaxID=3002440 RepID=UPI002DB67A33|nr:hypothetical protein [Flavobacterium sp. SUN046]MEC4051136.1 hypothetical protein [Flavobacterium sp. SUN046]
MMYHSDVMRNDEAHKKMKYCLDVGYRIYVKPIDNYTYKIVIAKSTKYKWSDIPKDKMAGFEQVDGIIYSLKIGDIKYRAKPKENDEKWWEKIQQLYESIYQKLINKNHE